MTNEIRELSMDEIEFVSGAGTTLSWRNLANDIGLGAASNSSNTVLSSDGGSVITNKPDGKVIHLS
jgi:hypothetical protein